MTRWEPVPTPLQRWFVHHRTAIRVVVFVLLAAAVGTLALVLITEGLVLAAIGPAVTILVLVNSLFLLSQLETFVSHHDTPPVQRSNPE